MRFYLLTFIVLIAFIGCDFVQETAPDSPPPETTFLVEYGQGALRYHVTQLITIPFDTVVTLQFDERPRHFSYYVKPTGPTKWEVYRTYGHLRERVVFDRVNVESKMTSEWHGNHVRLAFNQAETIWPGGNTLHIEYSKYGEYANPDWSVSPEYADALTSTYLQLYVEMPEPRVTEMTGDFVVDNEGLTFIKETEPFSITFEFNMIPPAVQVEETGFEWCYPRVDSRFWNTTCKKADFYPVYTSRLEGKMFTITFPQGILLLDPKYESFVGDVAWYSAVGKWYRVQYHLRFLPD